MQTHVFTPDSDTAIRCGYLRDGDYPCGKLASNEIHDESPTARFIAQDLATVRRAILDTLDSAQWAFDSSIKELANAARLDFCDEVQRRITEEAKKVNHG
jgi:hypothetical protein